MDNAKGKIPYVIKILEESLSKERKNLDFWNRMLKSDDLLIVRQAKSNFASNQERLRQLEEVMVFLCPPKPEEEPTKAIS